MKIKTLLAAVLLAAPILSWSAPITIKFSHVVAENTPKGQMALKFKELVEERLPGQVHVDVYPNAQLFGDDTVLQAMILGDVQMAAPSLSKLQKYTDKLQIFDLPFLFKDLAAAERFQKSDVGQKLLMSMRNKGLIGLGYLHNGMKQLTANDPVIIPSDAKGKKFRIMTSDVLQAQFEAVNAMPLKKPFAEVFTLLQTKAIDGQENTWSNIYSKKFYEVQPYITETNHGLLDYLVVTSVEFWLEIPEENRGVIKKSLDEAIEYGNEKALAFDLRDRKLIADSGVSTIYTLTDSQREEWVNAMRPVWNKFSNKIGSDLINAAVQSNEE
ncbi:TRAP transporter substrate-binding protein [Zhongshania sp. BJYM1]|uniref:TRAP transporter substrate-binding protein n=1 Tax=Zhongshania aquatica TaxID=2965069 RepID=UPI0022B3FE12|nr:TRAP transporter substrate-binding protein [Marortus sp. BJYM1]